MGFVGVVEGRDGNGISHEFFLFFVVHGDDGVAFGGDVGLFIDAVKIPAVLGEDGFVEDIVEGKETEVEAVCVGRNVGGDGEEGLAEIVHGWIE